MKVSKGQSRQVIVAAAFLILYMVPGSAYVHQVLQQFQVGLNNEDLKVPAKVRRPEDMPGSPKRSSTEELGLSCFDFLGGPRLYY